ncbi:MAG: chorismate synthase [Treponemataceae bacterium]
MSGNSFGKIFKVTTFGESHGNSIGCVIEGVPAGIPIDIKKIQNDMNRRRPFQTNPENNSEFSLNKAISERKEEDKVEILSGIFEGKSIGTPITIVIKNLDPHSFDYEQLKDKFRPSHADYTYCKKYGTVDYRGGGRSSGRETAARVAAGAVAKIVLENYDLGCQNIQITASTVKVCNIEAVEYNRLQINQNPLRCADKEAAKKMLKCVEKLKERGDSAGGIVECIIDNVPAGLGEPVFDKLDALLAHAMLSIGSVKGIEFGAGFDLCNMTGSKSNDQMFSKNNSDTRENTNGDSVFSSNNAGGILGGISNGNKIVFRVAVKPVPSISIEQNTIDINGSECKIKINGRHDVCLCPRIIPVVEAMSAMVLLDLALEARCSK